MPCIYSRMTAGSSPQPIVGLWVTAAPRLAIVVTRSRFTDALPSRSFLTYNKLCVRVYFLSVHVRVGMTSRSATAYVSRSNIGPNPDPAASSPSTSTIISPLAIGGSTSSPWPTTTTTSQASWPPTSSSPSSSSSSYLRRSRCCPPSKVRPNHLHWNHLPWRNADTLTTLSSVIR